MLAQLVGLPDEVDEFGEVAVLPPAGRAAGLGRGREDVGDAAQLREDRPATRLGRVRGEDRPHGEFGQCRAQRGGTFLLGDRGHGEGEPPLVRGPGTQAAHPVYLFGHVRQLEVRGERPDEDGGGLDRLLGQQAAHEVAGGVLAGLALLGQCPDPLDEIQRVLTLLAHERLAEQGGDPPDIGP